MFLSFAVSIGKKNGTTAETFYIQLTATMSCKSSHMMSGHMEPASKLSGIWQSFGFVPAAPFFGADIPGDLSSRTGADLSCSRTITFTELSLYTERWQLSRGTQRVVTRYARRDGGSFMLHPSDQQTTMSSHGGRPRPDGRYVTVCTGAWPTNRSWFLAPPSPSDADHNHLSMCLTGTIFF